MLGSNNPGAPFKMGKKYNPQTTLNANPTRHDRELYSINIQYMVHVDC